MSAPTRRAILAGAGAAVALPAAIAPAAASASPDAELVRLCGEFDACEVRARMIYDGPDTDQEADAEAESIENHMVALLDRLEAVHAATAEGILARARTVAIHAGDGGFSLEIGGTMAGRLVAVLLRDALAMSGLPVPNVLRPGQHKESEPDAASEKSDDVLDPPRGQFVEEIDALTRELIARRRLAA